MLEWNVYRCVDTAVIHTYRPVIDNPNLHHGLENAVLDLFRAVKMLHSGKEVVVQFFGYLRLCSTVEIWFIALLCRSVKCELGY